jgi:holo-[acyl-carrier protein] synthase
MGAATLPKVRVGCDLVRVAAVADSLAAFGERYLRRIFTAQEALDCRAGRTRISVESLAARFAAKEAALKVLRPDRHWFDWRTLEVVKAPQGWVRLHLHGLAATAAAAQGLDGFSLSFSHEGGYAMAVVMAHEMPLEPQADDADPATFIPSRALS